MRGLTSSCIAILCACLVPTIALAQQQDGASSRDKLDRVLAVLRDRNAAASKPCLDAMTKVHQTEDQVSDLAKSAGDSGRHDDNADIAKDVLDSDYETAQGICQPDAVRACATAATAVEQRDCAALARNTAR
jgi:hypothetical protein